jgi:hypothetical protein
MMAAGYPPGPPPGGYGAPPGGGYAPPPGGVGGPPGGPPGGYGPPPGPTVQAQPVSNPPPAGAAPAKKSKAGLIIGIIVAILALGGGAAAAWWFWLRSTGPELAKYMPKDVQVYVEMPSLTKALVGFVDVDFIDDAELDADKHKDDAIDGFAASFDITKDEAETLMKSTSSVALGLRDVTEKAQGGVLIGFDSTGAVEPLLGSKRFDKDGEAAGGTKYKIFRREVDLDKLEKQSKFERAFDGIGGRKKDKGEDKDDDKEKEACVWWEDKKVFGCGDLDFLEDVGKVMAGDKGPLTKENEAFAAAKWPAGSSLLVYVDPEVIEEKEIQKGYFDGAGPILGSARLTDAGLIMNARVELKGKKVPKSEFYAPPGDLTLYERMPADTVAYAAFSTKRNMSYKDFEKELVRSLEETDERIAKEFDKAKEQAEDALGFKLETIYDAVGDEAILAVTASDKVDADMIKKKDKDALEHVGLVLAIHLGDKEKAEKVLKEVRGKIEELAGSVADVDKKDAGFVVKSKSDEIPVQVSVTIEEDKYLLVAGGQKKRVDDIKAAFAKDGDTLKADKAHAKALKALSGKNAAVIWIDTGRILKVALKDDKIKDELKKEKVPYKALKVEGDDRITSAMVIRSDVKDDMWILEIEDLNGMGLIPAAGAFWSFRSFGALPKNVDIDRPPPPTTALNGGGVSPADIPVTGIAACDDYLSKAAKCMPTLTKDNLKQMADAWKQAASIPAARPTAEQGCRNALDALKNVPGCN